jgi:isoquinoline 1-oxidoreductase
MNLPPLEPERYEFTESPFYKFEPLEVDRRSFLRLLSIAGGGLVVVSTLPRAAAQESGRGQAGREGASAIESWLHLDEQGRVTAYTGKVEIGQNARTSLTQAVADELDVPPGAITFVMGDTDLTPYDQGTFGSRTTPTMAPQLARAAATLRSMLIDLAAGRWTVDRGALRTEAGAVLGPGSRRATYGDLTAGRRLVGQVTAEAGGRDTWKLRGTPLPKINGRDFVTGRHTFTPDLTRPGMLWGRVIRPPVYGATPKAMKALAGIRLVHDANFIGVVAETDRAARRAAGSVDVQWTLPSEAPPTSETVFDHFKRRATAGGGGGRGGRPRVAGDVSGARRTAARVVEASYRIPYIAHVPLEPRAAVAEWADGKVTVWTGTQRPFGVRTEVAAAFGLSEDRVRVIVPDMGSGYGGKHTGEQAIEAARLAREVGRPVKVVYERDEEFAWGYLRPAGVIDVAAGLDASGQLTFWEFDNWNSGTAGIDTPYVIPNRRVEFHATDSPLRQGSYRGLAATANHYVREMHMDAVAREAGIDAVEFRMRHLDNARMRAVLQAAAERIGWPRASAADRAVGIACGTEKGSYVGTAAELARTADGFTVTRVVVTFECGAIVNPDGLRNQVEGSIVQGLGGALFEEIRFAEGRLLNGTMAQYRVPRFKDVPPIDVVLLDRPDLPSAGAGETPIVCVAPAIGAAARAFGDVPARLPVALVNQ